MKKRKLLIIDKHRFGNLTDSYKWCEYLRNKWDITIVCYKAEENIKKIDNIKLKEFPVIKNRELRGALFILFCMLNILIFRGAIMVVYFEKCILLKKIFQKKTMLLDIRSLAVSKNKQIRQNYNDNIIRTCKIYDFISVISEGVKQQINLPQKRIYILPLGSDIISTNPKNFQNLKLLYVGTLSNRNIEKTILGLSIFFKGHPHINLSYDIVGDGYNNELVELKEFSKSLKLDSKITFHGRIQHSQLKSFFDKCNIGVSFIPITEYFNNQPPTKSFEYILSGLYTIATKTTENKKIISSANGILINDTAEDFANALSILLYQKSSITEQQIRLSLNNFTWNKIVNNNLESILNEICY